MGDVFLSIRGRVLINVEALNMTESVGNYVKHRRVPVILPKEEYTTFFVPAISGEALAHGYQTVLAQEAKKKNLPVCKLCEKGIFLKSTNEEVFKEAFGVNNPPTDPHVFEKHVVSNCLVEDIGGFLYAPARGKMNVKRTSNFYTGYMIPVKEALEAVVIEPQLHSRYALGTPFVKAEARGQMIYYIELSSAPYTFAFDFDSRYVGKTSFVYEHAGETVVTNRADRICAALDALQKFILEFMFGAKKTRFLPVVEWESMVIAVSDDVWTVPSPFTAKYVENAKKKLEKISYNTKLHIYTRDSGKTLEETVIEAIEDAKSRLKQ
ncbi:MAG: type I-A CRISPR-associated protein Cas7/Csa2 [Desulfurococcales archaeon ex4484_217_2]|nr:MAG: type I-A CRISPR-associated protein Cas7/Csa2 [Desulfurococcales archaeon ex4484_217_2]